MTEPRSHPLAQTSPPSGSDHPPAPSPAAAAVDRHPGRADAAEPAAAGSLRTGPEIALAGVRLGRRGFHRGSVLLILAVLAAALSIAASQTTLVSLANHF